MLSHSRFNDVTSVTWQTALGQGETEMPYRNDFGDGSDRNYDPNYRGYMGPYQAERLQVDSGTSSRCMFASASTRAGEIAKPDAESNQQHAKDKRIGAYHPYH
jgi:hypothetical protein